MQQQSVKNCRHWQPLFISLFL